MHIDEARLKVLTKIVRNKKKNSQVEVVIAETDHNTMNAVLNMNWRKETKNYIYIEINKYDDPEALKIFK